MDQLSRGPTECGVEGTQPPLTRGMDMLLKEINRAEDLIGQINTKLSPVLSDQPQPVQAGQDKSEENSVLMKYLVETTDRMSRFNVVMEDLRNRIDL